MAELQGAARRGKKVGFSCTGQLKWLWASSSQVWEGFFYFILLFFLACWNRIIRLTERGWTESKENRTEDKVSMLTAVGFFTGEVIFTLNGLWPILVQHVMSPRPAVLHSELLTAASCYLVDEKYFSKGGYWTEFVVFTSSSTEMVILCIFLLLYRYFVIKPR